MHAYLVTEKSLHRMTAAARPSDTGSGFRCMLGKVSVCGSPVAAAAAALHASLQLRQHVQALVDFGDDVVCVGAAGGQQRSSRQTSLHPIAGPVSAASSEPAAAARHGVFISVQVVAARA